MSEWTCALALWIDIQVAPCLGWPIARVHAGRPGKNRKVSQRGHQSASVGVLDRELGVASHTSEPQSARNRAG
jgi:hypothetical protein